jgi:hypothetical protein
METVYRIHFENKYVDITAEKDYSFYFELIDNHVVVFDEYRTNRPISINFKKVCYIEHRNNKQN